MSIKDDLLSLAQQTKLLAEKGKPFTFPASSLQDMAIILGAAAVLLRDENDPAPEPHTRDSAHIE